MQDATNGPCLRINVAQSSMRTNDQIRFAGNTKPSDAQKAFAGRTKARRRQPFEHDLRGLAAEIDDGDATKSRIKRVRYRHQKLHEALAAAFCKMSQSINYAPPIADRRTSATRYQEFGGSAGLLRLRRYSTWSPFCFANSRNFK